MKETTIKERPILFSTPMVKAILDGNKTVTRRIIKVQPDADSYFEMKLQDGVLEIDYNQGDKNPKIECPYGKPGDILWVMERHYQCGRWLADVGDGEGEIWSRYMSMPILFHADDPTFPTLPDDYIWRPMPSIHMPKDACRIRLEIQSISVERLQDITEEGAFQEGIDTQGNDYCAAEHYQLGGVPIQGGSPAKFAFIALWERINGAGSWEDNPWVWRVEFKRLPIPLIEGHIYLLEDFTTWKVFRGTHFECLLTTQCIAPDAKVRTDTGYTLETFPHEIYKPERFK